MGWRAALTALALWTAPGVQPQALAVAGPITVNHPQSPIFVAYPDDGHRVAYDHVLLEGSVLPGASLQVNGRAIAVGSDGLFIEWWPLAPGQNTLRLTSQRGGQSWSTVLRVTRQAAVRRGSAAVQAITPRVAEVVSPDQGRGFNTVQAAWEDDRGQPVLYGRAGQRAEVVAVRGDLSRVRLSDGRLLWASTSTLRWLPAGTALPVATLGHPSLTAPGSLQPGPWQEVVWPVSARTPFALTENGSGLRLTVTGARLGGVLNLPANLQVQTWPEQATVQLDLRLPRPLHGYQAFYRAGEQGDSLVLRYRLAPLPGPLQGRRIVLDPGHGGQELGGAGPLRVPEKTITLPIALRVAELLRAEGAAVTLTRQDDRTVPLYSRPLLAETGDAGVLVSLHANALPDGKDPRLSRGVGSYFSHEQARPLAEALQRALVAGVPQAGDDGLHPGANLALTRPTSQPSVLLELGYLTDPHNLRLLMSASGQEAYAQAVAAGLRHYFANLPAE